METVSNLFTAEYRAELIKIAKNKCLKQTTRLKLLSYE